MSASIREMVNGKRIDISEFRALLPTADAVRKNLSAHPELQAFLVGRAERALGQAWPPLTASAYLDFARTGTRATFERLVFTRRDILRDLLLGELAEGQGRFVAAIADAVWSTTEEATWCWPAHLFLQGAGYGLADIDEPVVDLGTGATVGLLTMVFMLLPEALDAVSPMIRKRIERTVRQRLLDPCRDRDDFWWMGLTPHPIFNVIRLNNWNSWIGSNWLLAHIAFETAPEAFDAGLDRIIASLDRLLAIYGDDGGCPEGPSYWRAATSGLLQCLELLRSVLDGATLRTDERLRNIGRFIADTHIAEDYYVNFADAAPQTAPPACLVRRWADLVDDATLAQEANRLAARQGLVGDGVPFGAEALIGDTHQNILETLKNVAALGRLAEPHGVKEPARNLWFPSLQLLTARSLDDDDWFLAAKGGHNGDSHNHNDVGSMLVYRRGHPLLVDAGVGTYTAQTFSADRYKIWTMRSGYHNVPLVAGHEQPPGREFQARDVRYSFNDDAARLAMDIAGAYPADSGLDHWRREIALVPGVGVQIADGFAARQLIDAELRLLCAADASVQADGTVALTTRELPGGRATGSAVLKFDSTLFRVEIEQVGIDDPALTRHWGPHLTLLRLRALAPMARMETLVTLA